MKIKFLVNYSGRETAMIEYKKGVIINLPFAQAIELVKLEIACGYEEVKEKPIKREKVRYDKSPQ